MSDSSSSLVECPVCEEAFDPTAAGGWCTNSDCGEWRYEGADIDAGSDADSADEGEKSETAEPTPAIERVEEPTSGESETADESEDSAAETSEEATEPDGVDAVEAAVESGANAVGETVQSAAETVDEEGEEGSVDDTASEETADEADDEETTEITCPGCEETLDADTNFCPSCGEDVSAIEPGKEDELTECPSCGSDVGPEDSFCASCGEDLDAHREPEELTECPDCGADVDSEDSFCASCGEDLDAHRGTSGEEQTGKVSDGEASAAGTEAAAEIESADETSEPAPESLVLEVRGEELPVSDGDTVGRELRRIITESGGDEDDAVRVHREHVRFEREDGRFYLVDLGRNPTRLNETSMVEGDREPVAPGDEVTLSDVVTLAVREP